MKCWFILPLTTSKRDTELLLKLIANLNMLLRDENVNVVKKAILAMTQLYKVALQVSVLAGVGGALEPRNLQTCLCSQKY